MPRSVAKRTPHTLAPDPYKVRDFTRARWHTNDLCTIARSVLGPAYTLSIVLVGNKRAQALNRTYRNKDYIPNVLSFPLDTMHGEIFLNPAKIKREAHRYALSPENHLRYLLIHGCLHLKGHVHGGTMEQAEARLLKKFNIR